MANGKSNFRKKSIDARQSKKIASNAARLKELERTKENKWVDTTYTVLPTTLGAVSILNDLLPWDTTLAGSNESRMHTREGNSVVCKRYQCRGLCSITANVTNNPTDLKYDAQVRVIYFFVPVAEDNLGVPSAPVIGDILESPLDPIKSFYKKKGNVRYKVLKDYTINLQPNYFSTTAISYHQLFTSVEPFRKMINDVIDMRKLPDTEWYSGDTASIPLRGMLCRLITSDHASEPFAPTFKVRERLTYVDEV